MRSCYRPSSIYFNLLYVCLQPQPLERKTGQSTCTHTHTILCCTVLYCTVLYCTVQPTNHIPGGGRPPPSHVLSHPPQPAIIFRFASTMIITFTAIQLYSHSYLSSPPSPYHSLSSLHSPPIPFPSLPYTIHSPSSSSTLKTSPTIRDTTLNAMP